MISLSNSQGNQILLAHGGGGQLTDELVSNVILPRLANSTLSELLDSAVISPQLSPGDRMAMTIDSYVVQPLFFPGGDIGKIAVCGTVNDLCVTGARPLGIALSLVMTEGLDRSILERVLDSISACAKDAKVNIVTGDTKVIERQTTDGLFITTAGVGIVPVNRQLHPKRIEVGDVLIINGPIGEHGLAVMLARQMPEFQSVIQSDVAPLRDLIEHIFAANGDVKFMRDPTRGGLAGLACDLAQRTRQRVTLDETQIPTHPAAHHAAEMLGLDMLEIANEGKVVLVVSPEHAQSTLAAMKKHPLGKDSSIIGCIEKQADAMCVVKTHIGGQRIVQKPYGEQLPRIC